MNKNYRAGRALEYESMRRWEAKGYKVARSAGSHGIWDVAAVRPGAPVELIQCKVVRDVKTAERMLQKFKENPPLMPDRHYHQVLEIKVKGVKDIYSFTA